MADHCHITPGLPGGRPEPRPLTDIHHDAVFLHAFAQGVAELHDTIKTDLSPASNSMPAMFETLLDRCSSLVNDIEAWEGRMRHIEKGGAA